MLGYMSPVMVHGRMQVLEGEIIELALLEAGYGNRALPLLVHERIANLANELAELRKVHGAIIAEAERLGVSLDHLECSSQAVGWMDLSKGTTRCGRCGCPCAPTL